MTYDQVIKQLQALAVKKGINYQLERLNPLLKRLGNPEKKLKNVIHVAGTNGKGSTIAFMQSVCLEAGYSVGTFTSPHLHSYTERIRLNNNCIAEEEFCQLFLQCQSLMDHGLTEFETLTLMALRYFCDKKPDICLIEVGLGGRLDATNIIQPQCSVITHIDYDHQAILGNTITAITAEKAGIIKKGIPVVTTRMNDATRLNVITKKAAQVQTSVMITDPIAVDKEWQLQGEHQGINASLALQALNIIYPGIKKTTCYSGLKKAMIWGRFTRIEQSGQTIIIDGAHNIQGLRMLKKNMRNINIKDVAVVFGMHRSKNLNDMIPLIKTLGSTFYYCQFDNTFSHSYDAIQACFNQPIKQFKVDQALPTTKTILLTGSLYFVGDIYKNKFKIKQ
tara:strand:- start:1326 stop:2501 length:1176 start_codon:yes stop_codon:yes gene_type:complete